jgi:hypothetical protein
MRATVLNVKHRNFSLRHCGQTCRRQADPQSGFTALPTKKYRALPVLFCKFTPAESRGLLSAELKSPLYERQCSIGIAFFYFLSYNFLSSTKERKK